MGNNEIEYEYLFSKGLDYDSENEFNFCPMCGTDMEVKQWKSLKFKN